MCLVVRGAALDDASTTTTQRIISGAPNLTEMIFLLGAGEQVVGVSPHTEYPPEATKLPAVVDLFNPNIEAMLRLRPTMIFALPSNTKVIEFFHDRPGVELVVTKEVETLEQINDALLLVGRALGREQRAREIIAAQPEPQEHPADVPGPRVLGVVGYGPGLTQLYAVGHGTFLNQLLERAGATNVVPADLGKYPMLSKEALIRLNPDVILIMVWEEGDLQKKYDEVRREWRNMASLKAVKNGDFRFIVGKDLVIPGPRAPYFLPKFEQLIWETEPGGAVRAE
jgi:iron complex transport system substrate-binding protein